VTTRERRLALIAGVVAVAVLGAAVLWTFRVPIMLTVPTPPIVVTEKDQSRVVNMLIGQRIEVRLPVNSHDQAAWHVGRPLPFLPQVEGVAYTPVLLAPEGEGYQSTTFVAIGKGSGPLFLGYLPNANQNSYEPTRSFSVVVNAW
jgi:hypothetical protein